MNRSNVFDAIRAHLEADTNDAGGTRFAQVFIGEPQGVPPGGPYACAWYLGRAAAGKTLTNVMYQARIQIVCMWPMQVERNTIEDWETDIWGADDSLRTRFRGDSTLNSEANDLEITDSVVGYGGFPASANKALYRTLEFELQLDNLEGEAIAP